MTAVTGVIATRCVAAHPLPAAVSTTEVMAATGLGRRTVQHAIKVIIGTGAARVIGLDTTTGVRRWVL